MVKTGSLDQVDLDHILTEFFTLSSITLWVITLLAIVLHDMLTVKLNIFK